MAIVDDRGRLFGRVNVIDAVLGVLILGLIPLAYGALVLFKTPPPVLTRVEPSALTYGPNMRFTVRGENLRPYLRVYLDNHQSKNFLIGDTTEAVVELLDVPPGTYDVVLYDQAQERSRLPRGLTIAPSALPDAQLIVVGTLGNLTPEQAGKLTTGMTIDGIGSVTEVGRATPQVTRVFVRPGHVEIPVANARMVPVRMRIGCYVRSNQGQPECVTSNVSMQPSALLFLDTPLGKLPFQVDQVLGLQPLESVRLTVRFTGPPSVVAQIAAGDRDLGEVRNELSATATVDAVSPSGGGARDVSLTAQAQRGVTSWTYAMTPLRVGSSFTLRTARYELSGLVTAFTPPVAMPPSSKP